MDSLEKMIKEYREKIEKIRSRSANEYSEAIEHEIKVLERFKSQGLIQSPLYNDFLRLKNELNNRIGGMDNMVDALKKQAII